MEIRITCAKVGGNWINRFRYLPRQDGVYCVRTEKGDEHKIHNFYETIKASVGKGESYEIEIDTDTPDHQLRANLFDCANHNMFDYIGYLRCNILTGEWEDGKSGGICADEVKRIVNGHDQDSS